MHYRENSIASYKNDLLPLSTNVESNYENDILQMQKNMIYYLPTKNEWSELEWSKFNTLLYNKALNAVTEAEVWNALVHGARKVLRNYSTSFFIVTRFLPFRKRQQVEAIYAAVRYPDEVVDTFKISPDEKLSRINKWQTQYEIALEESSQKELIVKGIPPILVAFTRVVRDKNIPPHYYHSFLDAMRLDINPRTYQTLNDLINSYIYGSAIVVGYFLAYVYGSNVPDYFEGTLDASRNLGIALQLTNFMRDVSDDQKRIRVYIPLDMLKRVGINITDIFEKSSSEKLEYVINDLLDIADNYYMKAQSKINLFSSDCRSAIQACIDVYRQLNSQIRTNPIKIRHSVPLTKKFKVLPPSKYWRLPAAYLFGY